MILGSQLPAFSSATTSFNYITISGGLAPFNANLPGTGQSGFNQSGVYGPVVVAGSVPLHPCTVSGVKLSGCIEMVPSATGAVAQSGISAIHATPTGWECSVNGGAFSLASCPSSGGGGGGGGASIVIPSTPQFSVLSPQIVYNTPSASVNANISATTGTMIAATNTIHHYKFEWVVSLTAVGASCSGNTTVVLNAIFTNPNNSSPITQNISGTITLASSGNGTLGFIASGTTPIFAAPGTAVQYSTSSFTGGASCSPNPKYQVDATLVQEW